MTLYPPRFNAAFPAKITDATNVDDVWAHSWVEQFVDPVTGQLVDADPPRRGSSTDSPAYELNNVRTAENTVVWLKTRGVGLDNQIVYEFLHPASEVWVECDTEADSWPMYDADVITFSTTTRTWTVFTACYLAEANRDALVNGRRYRAVLGGYYGDPALPLYLTQCCDETAAPADPTCTYCGEEVPGTWSVTVAGFTGGCTDLNGSWELAWDSACTWEVVSGAVTYTLAITSTTATLTAVGSGGTVTWDVAVADEEVVCCCDLVLDLDSAGACSGAPATVTLTPGCAVEGCE